jgi:hypothetical protein
MFLPLLREVGEGAVCGEGTTERDHCLTGLCTAQENYY